MIKSTFTVYNCFGFMMPVKIRPVPRSATHKCGCPFQWDTWRQPSGDLVCSKKLWRPVLSHWSITMGVLSFWISEQVLGMVRHLVLPFWVVMAFSSLSNCPVFFSFSARHLTAFSNHFFFPFCCPTCSSTWFLLSQQSLHNWWSECQMDMFLLKAAIHTKEISFFI